jgi:hypothetical protein
MLPGETIASGASPICCGNTPLELKVLRSNAFYIGTFCDRCGPYSRESGYFATREEAEAALASGSFGR